MLVTSTRVPPPACLNSVASLMASSGSDNTKLSRQPAQFMWTLVRVSKVMGAWASSRSCGSSGSSKRRRTSVRRCSCIMVMPSSLSSTAPSTVWARPNHVLVSHSDFPPSAPIQFRSQRPPTTSIAMHGPKGKPNGIAGCRAQKETLRRQAMDAANARNSPDKHPLIISHLLYDT